MWKHREGKYFITLQTEKKLFGTDRFSPVCDQLLQYPEFILVHRSFLVNMNYIRLISTSDMQLQNGTLLPLAQRRVAEIRKHYLAFQMEEMP